MKYVLLGTLGGSWAGKQTQRTTHARDKLKELGIKLESILYTQGPYDFVDVIEAPDAEAALAFSVWYARQGFGRITTMPAFDDATMKKAAKRAK